MKSKSKSKVSVKNQKGGDGSCPPGVFCLDYIHIIMAVALVVLIVVLYIKTSSSEPRNYIDEDGQEQVTPQPTPLLKPFYYLADFIYPGYYDYHYPRYYNNDYSERRHYQHPPPPPPPPSHNPPHPPRAPAPPHRPPAPPHAPPAQPAPPAPPAPPASSAPHVETMIDAGLIAYPPPRQYLVNKEQERLINPLLPPERSYVLTNAGLPVYMDMPTRGYIGGFQQIGLLYKKDAKEDSNNETNILPLFGRPTFTNSNKWNYYTTSDKFHSLKIPLKFKGRDCNDENGCTELYDNDMVKVDPYNGEFSVKIYGYDSPKYIPQIW
jgi:hypothetical protein